MPHEHFATLEGAMNLTLREILAHLKEHGDATLFRSTWNLPDGRPVCIAVAVGDIGLVLHHTAAGWVQNSERAFYRPSAPEAAR